MHSRLALALVLAGSLTAVPAAAGARAPVKLKVRSCETGVTPLDRKATFYSRMKAVPGTDRMQMRFTLLDRTLRRRGVALRVPELATWRRSRPGVARFGYAQTVSGLHAGGVYGVRVEYRWTDAQGRTIKSLRRRSTNCRQGRSIANLVVSGVSSRPGAARGTEDYAIEVSNRGTAKAAEFDVSLIVDSAATDSARVHELLPGESTTVKITGPACAARVRVVIDRARAVTETTEDDNTLRTRCPAPR